MGRANGRCCVFFIRTLRAGPDVPVRCTGTEPGPVRRYKPIKIIYRYECV